jgi:small subunit ribosomal protein S9
MAKKINYTFAVGRRRTASARVRLFRGKGENTVNGKPIEEVFSGVVAMAAWKKPFGLTETSEKFYVSIKVTGGGSNSQLEASVHGIARTLAKTKKEYRDVLKQAGLLTRDARERERRMIGTGGKARRKKQSPKR